MTTVSAHSANNPSSIPSNTRVIEEIIVTTNNTTPAINNDVRTRVQQIIVEMNSLIKNRSDVIHGAWVGRIAQEHVLLLGPGGTGKSFLARTMANHITGSKFFEVALDETTDPSQLFGPPDIKAMVEDGKTRRVPTNMLPEATDAFLDEFFNANGPLLHSVMPALNERVWHNNGQPSGIPLRQCLMGTNKLNADADQAALWDRVHLRYVVDYVNDRDDQKDMVAQAITRMAVVGRGTTTSISNSRTTVTLEELDAAHAEALALDVPEATFETFLDIRDELRGQGITISDRRMVEGMAAVLANAWIRNHESVQVADLDILQAMWWTTQDQATTARDVILGITNPGEKAAMKLLDDIDAIKREVDEALKNNTDPDRLKRLGIEKMRNVQAVEGEATGLFNAAIASGADTTRIAEVQAKTQDMLVWLGKTLFGLDPAAMAAMSGR